jgi:hypothetical protein
VKPFKMPSMVDDVVIDQSTKASIFIIYDSLDWSDVEVHHDILKNKISHCLDYIKSGEALIENPRLDGHMFSIKVIADHFYNGNDIWPIFDIFMVVTSNNIDFFYTSTCGTQQF